MSEGAYEPLWLRAARRYIGVREIPGKAHSPVIQRWLRELKAWWDDDETPWCGVFVAYCLREVGMPTPQHWYRARAYLEYGNNLIVPFLGSIAVFERTGGGHVGFVVGRDERRRLMVLGGNQSNAVTIAAFDPSRLLGYRWPHGAPFGTSFLPPYNGRQPASTNEA